MNILKSIGVFLCDRFIGRNANNFTAHDKLFTRANLLTFSGIGAVGFHVAQFTLGFLEEWIPVTKIYIALTDMFDGWLADWYNEHSTIGKALDPWRDRMDVGATLWNVWYLFGGGYAAIWIAPVVFLEAVILCEGAWLYVSKQTVAEVHWIGKARMAVHQACAFAILVQAYWFEHFYVGASALLAFMAIASFAACVSYNFFHRKELVLILRRLAEGVF